MMIRVIIIIGIIKKIVKKDNRLKTEETPNEKIAVLKARRDVLPVRRLPVYSNIKVQLICYCFKWQCVCVCVCV